MFVCVCLCYVWVSEWVWVCGGVSLAALWIRFPLCAGRLVVSLYDTHEADILGRN